MIWNLIATVFAGLGAAGLALLAYSISRKRLPKWMIPVAAGVGMLGYQIYAEYTWFEFKQTQLPPASVVISSETHSIAWKPWTFVFPMTTVFTVLDKGNVRHITADNQNIAEFVLYRFEKDYSERVKPQGYVLNCLNGEMLKVNEHRKPILDSLKTLSASDPLSVLVCSD